MRPAAHNNSYSKWRAKVLTKIFILLLRSVTGDRNVFKTATCHSRALWCINSMRPRTIILFLITLLTTESVGQKLVDFKYSMCDQGNPHKYRMNTMINKLRSQGDTMTIDLTWIDNCSFDPEFFLKKVTNDTLFFEYKNKSDGDATCTCAFGLQFRIKKSNQRDFQIKINNWTID